jgi:hypothetical protein
MTKRYATNLACGIALGLGTGFALLAAALLALNLLRLAALAVLACLLLFALGVLLGAEKGQQQ